jgi:hypothetical protein
MHVRMRMRPVPMPAIRFAPGATARAPKGAWRRVVMGCEAMSMASASGDDGQQKSRACSAARRVAF